MIAKPESLRGSASQRHLWPCFILALICAGLVMMNAARAQGELAPATPLGAMGEPPSSDQPAAKLPSAASPARLGEEVKPLPQPQVTSAALSSKLPHDLSPWGMFQNAVVPVKLVMIGLAFASLITWTVWLAKSIELLNAKRQAKEELGVLARAESLAAAAKKLSVSLRTPIARFIAAAVGEAERSNGLAPEGVKDRTATLLSRIEAQAGHRILRGTGFLATIGATAPFVGLFGTVWGIMDSFIGISKTNTTNLAVVAPGIAEALLATALGLVAAIPAVVMYNAFARSITAYRAQLGDAAAEVLRHLSRDLDREALGPENKAAIVPLRQSAE